MVDTSGIVPTPETPSEYAWGGLFVILVTGAGVSGLTAFALLMIIPFINIIFGTNLDAPGQAVVYAEISAGLSMPVLAMLTGWYGYEMAKSAQTDIREQEARLEGFKQDLSDEILSHSMPTYETFEKADVEFEKSVFENNQDMLAMLDEDVRDQIRDYYISTLLLIESWSGQHRDQETYEQVSEDWSTQETKTLDALGFLP